LLYGPQDDVLRFKLYERTAAWQSVTGEALSRLGYPDAQGSNYLLARIQQLPAPVWLEQVAIERLLPEDWMKGRPYSTTWLDVVLSTQD
jgi:hypothetical protein